MLKSDFPDHELVLDLEEVKLVDRDAVRFLAGLEAEGARRMNCSAFIREWISRERTGTPERQADDQASATVRE